MSHSLENALIKKWMMKSSSFTFFLQYLTFSYHKPHFFPFKYYLFHQVNIAFRFDVVKYCIELQQP